MKKVLLVGAMLVLSASMASAQGGLLLSWEDCAGSGGGTVDKLGITSWNCNTNNNGTASAPRTAFLFAGFTAPPGIVDMSGVRCIIDYQASMGGVLAPWWDYNNYPATPAGCRVGFMTTDLNAAGSCNHWSGGTTVGGNVVFQSGAGGPDRVRIDVLAAMAGQPPAPVALVPGDEYGIMMFEVRNDKTIGASACAGCSTPVCMVFNNLLIGQVSPATPQVVNAPGNVNGLSSYVTWRTAANCPGATPAKKSSWGQIKSLYR